MMNERKGREKYEKEGREMTKGRKNKKFKITNRLLSLDTTRTA
jgi:hypothetical protein